MRTWPGLLTIPCHTLTCSLLGWRSVASYEVFGPSIEVSVMMPSDTSIVSTGPGSTRELQRVLIIEDDSALSSTLQAAFLGRARSVCAARSLSEAMDCLEPPPDLVLMDFALPDGTVDGLLDRLRSIRPFPLLIAMSGAASTEEAFRLAQTGVRGFLQKPFDLHQLTLVCERSLSEPPDMAEAIRQAVGKVSLETLEDRVRGTMIEEALAQSKGSRRGAAKLLDISRQLLQHIVKKGS